MYPNFKGLMRPERGFRPPVHLFAIAVFSTDFIFSTNLYRYQNDLKCISSKIEIRNKTI